MIVEFLFNEIRNKSNLYKEELIEDTSLSIPDTNSSICNCTEYLGKEYCTMAMEKVKAKVPNIQEIKYKGAMNRIANEVFDLMVDNLIYTVSCTIDTYSSAKSRMLVKILSENNNSDYGIRKESNDLSGSYDQVLEKIKLEIKNVFRPDWKSCIWIRDEQSEFLCSNLYSDIFRAENRLRAFANKLLIWELGSDWINNFGLEKYAESYKKLSEDFRSREPAFSDVDDVFISTTLETLFEIIQHGVVYESPIQLSHKDYLELISIFNKSNSSQNALKFIEKRLVGKHNIWNDIFEQYFMIEKNSQQLITDFIKNRNHIAHNKPITLSAYRTMKKSFTDFDDMVKNANEKFEESVPSEELYLTIDIQNEEAEDQEEFERNYLRERIEDETGVEILWRDSIFEMLIEKANYLYEVIYDLFYLNHQFTISSVCDITDDETWETLFTVKCNADERYYLELQAEIVIDDSMDGDSTLNIRCVEYGENNKIPYSRINETISATINYHNGSGYENNEEGYMELDSESYLDDYQMDDFIKELKNKIENLNPYIAKINSIEIKTKNSENISIVADFPCWECGKYGVSLREDFYKFGCCCYCGSDNEISICKKCGAPFGDEGGYLDICNSCRECLEKE